MNDDIVLVIPEDKIGFEPLTYPPLGLLYIASVLREEGYNVSIFDLREKENSIDKIPKAHFYCFTATTPQIESAKSCAKYVSEKYDCFTVIGGAHASFMSRELTNCFDCIVVGEGEKSIIEVVKNWLFSFGIYDKYKFGHEDINEIPFPARNLLKYDRVFSDKLWEGYGFGKGPVATTFVTSRGCPWKCSFCANIQQKVRYRSVENICEEMEILVNEKKCNNFRLLDDNFLMNRKRLRLLSPELKRFNINFRCSGRSDLLDEESCELLKQAGCKELGFGVETCDNKILKLINKGETVEHHEKAILLAKKYGIKTKAFFMSGLPFETAETIEKNKEFVKKVQPDKWIATLFTPFPGCDIWNNPEKYGIEIKERNFEKFFQSFPSKSVIERKDCTNEELTEHFEDFINFMEEYKKRK